MAQQSGIKSSGIGYGTFAPDLQSEQLRLQRQQQLIDALRKDSVTPIEQQTVTGAGPAQVVPVSKWQGLAKLGQAYFANNMQDSADQKQLALSKLLSERMGQQFDQMAGGGSGSQQPNYAADPNGTGGALPGQVGSGMADAGDMPQDLPLPSMPSQSPMDTDAPQYNGSALASALKKEAPQQPAQNLGGIASFLRGESTSPLLQGAPLLPQAGAVPMQQPTAFDMQKTKLLGQAKAAYLMGNQELANKLIENASMLTEEQRNMAAKGINPMDMGAAELAKAKASGYTNVAPNGTVINAEGVPVYVGSDFSKGVKNSFKNGNPVISPMEGSEIIPKMAGDIKRAEAQANAGSELITIPTPNGDIMVTKEQAAQMAGGAQQPNKVNFTASNGVKLNFDGMTPQQVFDNAFKSNDKVLQSAVKEWMSSGTQASKGIPLKSEAQKITEADTAKKNVEKTFDQPKEGFSLSSAIGSIDNSLKQIDYLEKHEGLSHITGTVAGRTPNVSNYATNAQADLDTLKSQISTQVITEMRNASKTGGAVGNMTEKEWPRLENQLGALQQAQSTVQFKERLKDVKETLSRVKNAYSTEYAAKYPKSDQQNNSPRNIRKWNPATGRIE